VSDDRVNRFAEGSDDIFQVGHAARELHRSRDASAVAMPALVVRDNAKAAVEMFRQPLPGFSRARHTVYGHDHRSALTPTLNRRESSVVQRDPLLRHPP
jgi:hypothetical protein